MSEPLAVDDLDRHLPAAGSIERAAVPMGMYLAWCANLELLDPAFRATHESAVLRLRYRDLTPAQFLTATCGGRIDESVLNEEGRAFTRAYYDRYLEDFRATFGAEVYAVADDWPHYDRIARLLTRRYLGEFRGMTGDKRSADRGAADDGRKWWQFWR